MRALIKEELPVWWWGGWWLGEEREEIKSFGNFH